MNIRFFFRPISVRLLARIFRGCFCFPRAVALFIVGQDSVHGMFSTFCRGQTPVPSGIGNWLIIRRGACFRGIFVDLVLQLILSRLGFPTLISRFENRLFSWRTARQALVGLAGFVTLIAIFYTEENWRGKRAWEHCKRELEAKGAVMDWDKLIPPPVPDDQNIFKAPKMQEWFVGRGARELSKHLEPDTLDRFVKQRNVIAEFTVVPAEAQVAPEDADLVLRYNHSIKTNACADTATLEQISKIIQNVITQGTNGIPSAKSGRGFFLVAWPLNQVKPARFVVRANKAPTAQEITKYFSQKVEPVGTNTFHVLPSSQSVYLAADYLAWSDQFESDFDIIREALKRPYARMEGDYQQPAAIPIPNFVSVRNSMQMFAQRAQCYLLLGRPEKALRELTLIHDLCRLLEGKPTGKPMTLVAAMINVAVTGLYVDTIADGFRLQAWREPQLAALEEQLKSINLPPFVVEAFKGERVVFSRTVETASRHGLKEILSFEGPKTDFFVEGGGAHFAAPYRCAARLALPEHGCRCQNDAAGD